ncbi:MAG: cupin domain-containing protein [Desulfobacter sp.]|nr:cupin domain-containing protein [Desulfobacter sp.]
MSINALIQKYTLAPHPEGGYFKEIYRSNLSGKSPVTSSLRHWATHIYFLLTQGQVSRFHRVAHDELWHFYQGDPLNLFLYDGSQVKPMTLGPGQNYMALVPRNVWQASETKGNYSFVGCKVAPGFDFADFSFLKDSDQDLTKFNKTQTQFKKFI